MRCPEPSLLLALATTLCVATAAPTTNSTRDVGLTCFQCAGDSRDKTPLCDNTFWKLTTRGERRDMTLKCPTKKAKFCVKKVVEGKHFVHTTRGCNGETDSAGITLRDGCTHIRAESSTIVCLCSTDGCNAAKRLSGGISLLALASSWARMSG